MTQGPRTCMTRRSVTTPSAERSLELSSSSSVRENPGRDSSWYDGEANNDFGSISSNFVYRHHVELRVKLYSPREESFPIPLKYIDVSRTTHTNLDVLQESRIDDYGDIDGSRDLSDPWTDFTQFTPSEEKPPEGYIWSRGRLTKGKRHPARTLGENGGKNDVGIRRKRTSNFPCYKSFVHRSTEKQRPWKIVDTLLCRFGNDREKWWADSMECHCYLRNIQDLSSDGGNHHMKGGSECHLTDQ